MSIRTFADFLVFAVAMAAFNAYAGSVASESTANSVSESPIDEGKNWFDRIFETELDQYANVKECIRYTAHKFNLQKELLVAVLMTENGIAAPVRRNNDGTYDLGFYQINQVRLPELKRFQVTEEQLINNHCLNTYMAGYLLWSEIDSAGDFWSGVGNYHYGSWGEYPQHHYRYIKRVYENWTRLTRLN